MQIPIIRGSKAGKDGEFRESMPVNYVPVPRDQGISQGYLNPAPGIDEIGRGPGVGRGGFAWNGALWRVMGGSLLKVDDKGGFATIGSVGSGEQVSMDNSFDHLGIASGGRFYLLPKTGGLQQVTDPDLGFVIDLVYIAGYWMVTDGTTIAVTELNDPFSVLPTKYGSAEADPDAILAVDTLRGEAYAFGRYTIESFANVGGNGFPFRRIDGSLVPKGILGTHTYARLADTFVFLGSGKNEPPAIFVMTNGSTRKVSTREVDQILAGYPEKMLGKCLMESQVVDGHQFLMLHLPDQSLFFDAAASAQLGDAVWHIRKTKNQYRAQNFVWAYDAWHVEDPQSPRMGRLNGSHSKHYGITTDWSFDTGFIYNAGMSGLIHELELVALPGRVQSGMDPTVWTSYSMDGETWSQERSIRAGKEGERMKRLCWRGQGRIGHYRTQRFRGTSETHMAVARLEAQIEGLTRHYG